MQLVFCSLKLQQNTFKNSFCASQGGGEYVMNQEGPQGLNISLDSRGNVTLSPANPGTHRQPAPHLHWSPALQGEAVGSPGWKTRGQGLFSKVLAQPLWLGQSASPAS